MCVCGRTAARQRQHAQEDLLPWRLRGGCLEFVADVGEALDDGVVRSDGQHAEDEDEALTIANDVDYGLAGYLWTRDIPRAHRFARDLAAGMIWINSENNRHLPAPFGGMKASGIGRDGGDYSFDFYMERKNICVALGEHKIPTLGVK